MLRIIFDLEPRRYIYILYNVKLDAFYPEKCHKQLRKY